MIDSIDRNGGKYGKHPDGDISSTRQRKFYRAGM
jgi:hypothetical protein